MATLVLAGAGCAADSQLQAAGEEAVAASTAEEGVPYSFENPNPRSGGLAELCWARNEIAARVAHGYAVGTEAQRAARLDDLEALVDDLTVNLDARTADMPAGASAFRDHFSSNLSVASNELKSREGEAEGTYDRMMSLFAFDQYPGVDEYLAISKMPGGCPEE